MSAPSLSNDSPTKPGGPAKPTPSSGWKGSHLLLWQVGVGLSLLLLWELTSGRLYDVFWISRPSLVMEYLVQYWTDGLLMKDLTVTFKNAIIGYLLGSVFGVFFGFLLASAKRVADVLNPYIIATYGIPRIALAPLMVVWFGIGDQSKIFLAAMMAFMLTFFNTYTGVRSVEPPLLNVARVMGASKWQLVYKVILPAASPWIIAGLQVSFPNALVSAVVGEFIAASAGLGFRLSYNGNTFNTAGTMAGVLLLMVIVLILNNLLERAEAYLLRWRPKDQRR
ncbi:MAG: ABC transporter permease [Bacillota bacterium]